MTMTRVSVPGSAEGLREVARAFDAFRSGQGIAEPDARSVQVVLDEILSNTVRLGFAPGRTGRIEAGFEIDGGVLDILIVDDGIAFDPLSRADPDTAAPLESRPIGGLGIHLVKKLMDEVTYERRDGENRLRLKKRIIGG